MAGKHPKKCQHFCLTCPSEIIAILWHPAQLWHSKLIYSLTAWEDPVTAFKSITQRGFHKPIKPAPIAFPAHCDHFSFMDLINKHETGAHKYKQGVQLSKMIQ